MQKGKLSEIKSLVFDIHECENQSKLCFGYSLKKKQNQSQEMELMMNDFKRFENVKYLRKYLFCKANSDQYLFERPEQYITLRQIIKPEEEIILKIIADILVALHTLHQNQLIGRCFNIDNIIFVQGQYACLMEFGFFPAVDYLTPEEVSYQMRNEKLDVFHLGRVVFYLMVGNELPKYTMENFPELDDTINFHITNTKYSQNLKLLAQSLLNKEKAKRIDFMSLIEKFKAYTLISQMSTFYSSKRQLDQLVKVIEGQSELRNQIFASFQQQPNGEAFPMVKSGHLPPVIGTGKSQNVIFAIPQVQEMTDLDPPGSDDEFDNGSLFPPKIDDTQPINQNPLVRKYETYQKLTDVLPYLYKDLSQELEIWNKIYFSFYRISIIKKLLQEVKSFQNLSDAFVLHLTNFALNKIMLIIKKEINSAFQNDQNIFDIDPQEWKRFVTNESYKVIKKSIAQDLEISIKQFNLHILPQLQTSFKKFNLNPYSDSYINEKLDYPNFDSYKNEYRKILNSTLEFFEHCQGSESPLIQLLVFFCILINKILDPQLLSTNYQNITQYIKENQIESFIDIERFLTLQNQSLFIDLKQYLIKTYFS